MNRRFVMGTLALTLVGVVAMATLGPAGTPEEEGRVPRETALNDRADLQPNYSAEELALLAIQEEGRRQVLALADQIKAELDPERRQELQTQAITIKIDTRMRFLSALAGFARERGDLETEREALAQIENLKHPRRAKGEPIRQTPGKDEVQRGAQ
ncbi:MAG: hypothetical protein ABIF77_08860 [bacterium]